MAKEPYDPSAHQYPKMMYRDDQRRHADSAENEAELIGDGWSDVAPSKEVRKPPLQHPTQALSASPDRVAQVQPAELVAALAKIEALEGQVKVLATHIGDLMVANKPGGEEQVKVLPSETASKDPDDDAASAGKTN